MYANKRNARCALLVLVTLLLAGKVHARNSDCSGFLIGASSRLTCGQFNKPGSVEKDGALSWPLGLRLRRGNIDGRGYQDAPRGRRRPPDGAKVQGTRTGSCNRAPVPRATERVFSIDGRVDVRGAVIRTPTAIYVMSHQGLKGAAMMRVLGS
jgi:hypothetical protein